MLYSRTFSTTLADIHDHIFIKNVKSIATTVPEMKKLIGKLNIKKINECSQIGKGLKPVQLKQNVLLKISASNADIVAVQSSSTAIKVPIDTLKQLVSNGKSKRAAGTQKNLGNIENISRSLTYTSEKIGVVAEGFEKRADLQNFGENFEKIVTRLQGIPDPKLKADALKLFGDMKEFVTKLPASLKTLDANLPKTHQKITDFSKSVDGIMKFQIFEADPVVLGNALKSINNPQGSAPLLQMVSYRKPRSTTVPDPMSALQSLFAGIFKISSAAVTTGAVSSADSTTAGAGGGISNTYWYVGGGLLALAAIGAVGFFSYRKFKKPKENKEDKEDKEDKEVKEAKEVKEVKADKEPEIVVVKPVNSKKGQPARNTEPMPADAEPVIIKVKVQSSDGEERAGVGLVPKGDYDEYDTTRPVRNGQAVRIRETPRNQHARNVRSPVKRLKEIDRQLMNEEAYKKAMVRTIKKLLDMQKKKKAYIRKIRGRQQKIDLPLMTAQQLHDKFLPTQHGVPEEPTKESDKFEFQGVKNEYIHESYTFEKKMEVPKVVQEKKKTRKNKKKKVPAASSKDPSAKLKTAAEPTTIESAVDMTSEAPLDVTQSVPRANAGGNPEDSDKSPAKSVETIRLQIRQQIRYRRIYNGETAARYVLKKAMNRRENEKVNPSLPDPKEVLPEVAPEDLPENFPEDLPLRTVIMGLRNLSKKERKTIRRILGRKKAAAFHKYVNDAKHNLEEEDLSKDDKGVDNTEHDLEEGDLSKDDCRPGNHKFMTVSEGDQERSPAEPNTISTVASYWNELSEIKNLQAAPSSCPSAPGDVGTSDSDDDKLQTARSGPLISGVSTAHSFAEDVTQSASRCNVEDVEPPIFAEPEVIPHFVRIVIDEDSGIPARLSASGDFLSSVSVDDDDLQTAKSGSGLADDSDDDEDLRTAQGVLADDLESSQAEGPNVQDGNVSEFWHFLDEDLFTHSEDLLTLNSSRQLASGDVRPAPSASTVNLRTAQSDDMLRVPLPDEDEDCDMGDTDFVPMSDTAPLEEQRAHLMNAAKNQLYHGKGKLLNVWNMLAMLLSPYYVKQTSLDKPIFSADDFLNVIFMAQAIFEQEYACLTLQGSITGISDIHGDYRAMVNMLFGTPEELVALFEQFLFHGDIPDRGLRSSCAVLLSLVLKICAPHMFHFLRGNHEMDNTCARYGLQEDLIRLYPKRGMEIYNALLDLYEAMPLAAVTNKKAFHCHGMISEEMIIKDGLKLIKKTPKNETEELVKFHLLWADPRDFYDEQDPTLPYPTQTTRKTPGVWNVNSVQVREFLKLNNLKTIIRGHEQIFSGIDDTFGDKTCWTFFTAPNCRELVGVKANPMSTSNNYGAIVRLRPNYYYFERYFDRTTYHLNGIPEDCLTEYEWNPKAGKAKKSKAVPQEAPKVPPKAEKVPPKPQKKEKPADAKNGKSKKQAKVPASKPQKGKPPTEVIPASEASKIVN